MSLFKSLTGLAKATYQLAKEDKEFRKEYAIATVTFPITAGKAAFDALDNATGATKNFETVLDKVDSMYKDRFEVKSKFDTYVDKQSQYNQGMSENVELLKKLHDLKEFI